LNDTSITAEPPVAAAPPGGGEPGVLRRNAVTVGFLAPAAVLLGVWIVYPTVYTVARRFFGHRGFGDFVRIDNRRGALCLTCHQLSELQ